MGYKMETQKEQELHKEIMEIIKSAKYDTKMLYKEFKLFSIYFGTGFLSVNSSIEYKKFNDELKEECYNFIENVDNDLKITTQKGIADINDDLKKCYELLEEIKKIKNNINGI